MEDMIIVGGAALLSGVIGLLIGHSLKEKRHAATIEHAREAYENERDALRHRIKLADIATEGAETTHAALQADFVSLQTDRNMLEQAYDGQERTIDQLKQTLADVETKRDRQFELLCQKDLKIAELEQTMFARDVSVESEFIAGTSPRAKRLITRGVRKANKVMRAKLEKVQAKADNYGRFYDEEFAKHGETLQAFTRYKQAVRHTLNDKIGLVGVRRALKAAIRTEVDRLREVEQINEFTGGN